MKSLEIEVLMGGKVVKTFTIHDFVEGKWKWVCRTQGTGGSITSGHMQNATVLIEVVQGQERQIGYFTVSVHEIKKGDEFKICFLISKPGEPEAFLTLDCKCTKRDELAPQSGFDGKGKNTKTTEQVDWETQQIPRIVK